MNKRKIQDTKIRNTSKRNSQSVYLLPCRIPRQHRSRSGSRPSGRRRRCTHPTAQQIHYHILLRIRIHTIYPYGSGARILKSSQPDPICMQFQTVQITFSSKPDPFETHIIIRISVPYIRRGRTVFGDQPI